MSARKKPTVISAPGRTPPFAVNQSEHACCSKPVPCSCGSLYVYPGPLKYGSSAVIVTGRPFIGLFGSGMNVTLPLYGSTIGASGVGSTWYAISRSLKPVSTQSGHSDEQNTKSNE